MGTLETAEFLKTYKGQLRIGIFWFRDSYRNTGARMLKTLSFLLFSSLLISSCTALPASQDRFFLFNNPLCQQRVRTQCATQCLSQEPSAMCSGSCSMGFGRALVSNRFLGSSNTYSFRCGDIQPLATTSTPVAAPAPDGQGPIRNDGANIR